MQQLATMKIYHFCLTALALSRAEAYLVSPAGTAAPGTIDTCSEWVQDSYALTCAIIETFYGLTEEQFEEWVCKQAVHSLVDQATHCTHAES